jgi:hypothetical protein
MAASRRGISRRSDTDTPDHAVEEEAFCAQRRKIVFLGENPMSVEDAATTVFSAEHDVAIYLLHMRAQGVSFLVELKRSGLPVILHWGADLGDLDGLSAPALLAAFGPTSLDPLLAGARARPWPGRMTATHPRHPLPAAVHG